MKKIEMETLQFNPFEKIGKEWFLIGAQNSKKEFNAMTASWGGLGVLWNKNVATIYIRPQRHTKLFVDDAKYVTLQFFDAKYKKELGLYGTKSGKDINKEKACGFHVVECEQSAYIEEADLVFVCKKIYEDTIKPECMVYDEMNTTYYPEVDHHTMYIVEIVGVYQK